MNRLIAAVVLTFGLLGGVAKAEFGFDASWSGMYGTGGYNLYGFGSDMYNLGGFMGGGGYSGYGGGYDSWYGGNWGGSCGASFSGCSGGYDYANLGYGMGYPSTDINILINIGGGYGGNQYGGGSCGSAYSPYAPVSCGCTMGCSSTCGHSHQQPQWGGFPNYYSQFPSMPLSPTLPSWPTMPSWPTTPSYPIFPSNPNIPGSSVFVNVTYPPSLPPWGGCGGVVQCPTGPVTPPPTVQQPTYSYVPNTTANPPVRFTVPRAVHSR